MHCILGAVVDKDGEKVSPGNGECWEQIAVYRLL